MAAGALDEWVAAEGYFDQALELHRAMRAPFLVANTEIAYADMLVSREPRGKRTALALLAQVENASS